MVMGAMRNSAKWVMLTLVIAFVGWLVLDWVQSRQSSAATGPNPVVLTVNRQEIRLVGWSQLLQGRLDLARSQADRPLTDEEVRQIREVAWETLISQVVLEQELRRLSIEISDAEVQEAFRTSPPPDLLNHPAFQTDGRFDYEKYRQFFANPVVDGVLLLQIESYYRNALPRQKLAERIQASVYVSDDDVWRAYRDRQQTARVRFLTIDPSQEVSESDVEITSGEVEAYYREHRDEFERPATAIVNIVSLSAFPSAADTAATAARADSLRQLIVSGEAKFEELARSESADAATAPGGGSLGRFARGDLAGPVGVEAFTLPVGEVSDPILSPRGVHLLRVDSRDGDTVTASHILLPVRLSDETEDELFDRLDGLEGIALDDGLAAAADSLGIQMRVAVTLTEAANFVPGAGALGVGIDWAFDPTTLIGDLSQFFENASGYHMLELTEVRPAGTFDLLEVEPSIRQLLFQQKRQEAVRELAAEALAANEDATLSEIGERTGWPERTSQPFTRLDFVPGLGRDTEAVGIAFGLPMGHVGDPADAGETIVLLEVLERSEPSLEAFEAAKVGIRAQLTLRLQQQQLNQWLQGVRDRANVRDLRDRLVTQNNTPFGTS
ncbi:MAG: peptidyl-prolyl cis-trans isomerase [Gemmatimonadetes bacterium]|nr:peptidyl-prolyl cis-trans isomerase [Gemmatimonadota bacterium]